MHRGSLISALVASTVLVACATPGPKEALEPIEAELTSWAAVVGEVPSAPVTRNWLADLQDRNAEVIVPEALLNNYNIQVLASRAAAARNQAQAVRSGLLPQAGGSLSGSRSEGPQFFGPQQFDLQVTSLSLGANVSWEPDIWGRLTDATRAAYLDANAQELDFAAARLSLAADAARSYYAVIASRLQRQLAERDVETGQANLNIIERRYQRGISTSLDLRLARSSLATSSAALQLRQQQELEARRQLEVLLGRYPKAEIDGAANLPALAPLAGSSALSVGSPASLLERRPDIVAAERRLKAAGLRVSEARKAFLPSISLQAGVSENAQYLGERPDGSGGTIPADEVDISDLFDFDLVTKRLVANLTQPIFQGGRLIANERQAKNNARAALFTYGQTALTAWREVEDAIAAESLLMTREEALATAAEEAAAAEDLTERRYLAGTTNIFDLINAQQRRIQAEGQLIEAKRARLNNRVNLYLALGAPYVLEGEETPLTTAAIPSAKIRNGQGDLL
ncbi:MAG: TolC family protein [Parvularcula sp.]|jgi:NodT family efflux transporter outer membrane factor (OMF) lipoprotein|nr:TolC family protein [Parvularcula sp.]